MLTAKQKELLLLIHHRVQDTGVPPSFEEMKEALDLKSKSGIHRLITALEERGFIRRLPHRARALEIVKLPEALHEEASPPPQRPAFRPQVIEGGRSSSFGAPPPQAESSMAVPMMGRIAAGVPISAIQDHSQDVLCPPDMVGPGEHFALEVVGDGAGLRVCLVAELGSAAFAYDPIEAGRDGNVGKQIIAREPLEDGDRPCLRVREGGQHMFSTTTGNRFPTSRCPHLVRNEADHLVRQLGTAGRNLPRVPDVERQQHVKARLVACPQPGAARRRAGSMTRPAHRVQPSQSRATIIPTNA